MQSGKRTKRESAEHLLRAVLATVGEGIVTIDTDSRIVMINEAAQQMWGYSNAELVGEPLEQLLPAQQRARHEQGMRDYLKTGSARLLGRRVELQALRKDGFAFPIELQIQETRLGEQLLFTAAVRDISEQKRAERRMAAQYAVTQVLTSSPGLHDALISMLQQLGQALGWQTCELWLIEQGGGRLRCRDFWHSPAMPASQLRQISQQLSFGPGQGLPGRILQSAEPLWIEDLHYDGNFPRLREARNAGLHSAFGVPIRVHGELLGVLCCFHQERQRRDPELLALLETIGSQIGQFIQRKSAEQALRESEQRFRIMANSAPVMIWLSDPDGRSSFFNEPWLAFTGRTLEQELGSGWCEGVHPEDLERCLEIYRSSFAARQPFQQEYRLRRADGSYGWILDHGIPRWDSTGSFAGFIGSCVEITGHRLAEERLKTLTEAASSLLSSLDLGELLPALLALSRQLISADGYAVWRRQPEGQAWQVLSAEGLSPQFQQESVQVLGNAPATVREAWVVSNVADDPRLIHRLASYQREGVQAMLVLPLLLHGDYAGTLVVYYRRRRDFADLDLRLAHTLAQLASAAITTAELYSQQQRLRQHAEQTSTRLARLQATTAALSQALTRAQVAQVIVGQGRATLGAHMGAVSMADADTGELELLAAEGFSQELVEAFRRTPLSASNPAADAVRSAEPIYLQSAEEYVRRYPAMYASTQSETGSQAIAALPLRIEERTIGAMAFSFPSSHIFDEEEKTFLSALALQCAQAFERARLYDEARQAIKLRDQFFALAAHELRTPMTTIMGSAQLIQRSVKLNSVPGEREVARAQALVDQVQRLNRLIRSMLDLTRIQDGRLSIERAPFDLAQLIGQLVDELRLTQEQHSFELRLPEQPVIVNGDRVRIEQVLQNVLQNAIKYSIEGGTISLVVELAGGQVCCAIHDQGIGIPEEDLPHIFERFYRARNVSIDYISGMGIGLYIVKEIIAMHGGSVSVASSVGAGTTVTICLAQEQELPMVKNH